MCGVIGYYPTNKVEVQSEQFAKIFTESGIRGLHAFGLVQDGEPLRSFAICDIIEKFDPKKPALAHARYSTSGDWRVVTNNQPLVFDEFALVFNGVIHMGTREEMMEEFDIYMETDNDGEVFLRLMEKGENPSDIIQTLKGSFAGLWMNTTSGTMHVIRNERRPLWWVRAYGAIWYASTRDIFLRSGFPPPIQVPVGVWEVPRS